ncbi:hypothetical protein MRB53_023930 [Persea americana]|uniref:Uncharacterized protein n=1 Tax=Persea americana TaxID=3435 RepID=A0ACC2LB50_PERAE|nr:hypothetical protein MRB53_023930 [Persea americana]
MPVVGPTLKCLRGHPELARKPRLFNSSYTRQLLRFPSLGPFSTFIPARTRQPILTFTLFPESLTHRHLLSAPSVDPSRLLDPSPDPSSPSHSASHPLDPPFIFSSPPPHCLILRKNTPDATAHHSLHLPRCGNNHHSPFSSPSPSSSQRQQPSLAIFIALSIFVAAVATVTRHLPRPLHLPRSGSTSLAISLATGLRNQVGLPPLLAPIPSASLAIAVFFLLFILFPIFFSLLPLHHITPPPYFLYGDFKAYLKPGAEEEKASSSWCLSLFLCFIISISTSLCPVLHPDYTEFSLDLLESGRWKLKKMEVEHIGDAAECGDSATEPSQQKQQTTNDTENSGVKCVEMEGLACSKSVILDEPTRWNSTYLMLDIAMKYQKAFERLKEDDLLFVSEVADFGGPPSPKDWEEAHFLSQFLKRFYDAAICLSGSLYVIAHLYFTEIYAIESFLYDMSLSLEDSLSNMAKKMKVKFEKYQGRIEKVNMMLVVAVVLDPRLKLDHVKFSYYEILTSDAAEELTKKVRNALYRLHEDWLRDSAVSTDVEENIEEIKAIESEVVNQVKLI